MIQRRRDRLLVAGKTVERCIVTIRRVGEFRHVFLNDEDLGFFEDENMRTVVREYEYPERVTVVTIEMDNGETYRVASHELMIWKTVHSGFRARVAIPTAVQRDIHSRRRVQREDVITFDEVRQLQPGSRLFETEELLQKVI